MNISKIIFTFTVCVVIVSSACTYSPENYDWGQGRAIEFNGFAQNPSATIEIQVYHQRDGVWHTLHTATSSTVATTLAGDSLYSWDAQLNFNDVPESACYWGIPGSCVISAGVAHAKIRFKEIGSDLPFLVTFDEGGVECVLEEMTNGSSWISAGATCASEDTPVLTLPLLT